MQKGLARFMVALVATAFLVIPGLSFAQADPCAAKNPCAAPSFSGSQVRGSRLTSPPFFSMD